MKLGYFFGSLIALLVIDHRCFAVPPVVIKQCIESTQPPVLDLALMYGTEFLMVSTPAKCYIACIFESIGYVTDKGEVSEDIILFARTPKEKEELKALRTECSDSKDGECEASYAAIMCWLTHMKTKV